MIRIAICLTCLSTLTACVQPVGKTTASFLNQADAPIYLNTQATGITSRNCLKPRRGGFGSLPPGCFVDTVFANQVAYPHDLVSPHTPGPTSPTTTATAAASYLYGEEAGVTE